MSSREGQRVKMLSRFGNSFHELWNKKLNQQWRRYRFVEEGLTIDVPETEEDMFLARSNVKLWHRIDANKRRDVSEENATHYSDVLARSEELLFLGLAEMLKESGDGICDTCLHRDSYGAETSHCFGGFQLCDRCKVDWRRYLESFPVLAAKAFPEVLEMYNKGIVSTKWGLNALKEYGGFGGIVGNTFGPSFKRGQKNCRPMRRTTESKEDMMGVHRDGGRDGRGNRQQKQTANKNVVRTLSSLKRMLGGAWKRSIVCDVSPIPAENIQRNTSQERYKGSVRFNRHLEQCKLIFELATGGFYLFALSIHAHQFFRGTDRKPEGAYLDGLGIRRNIVRVQSIRKRERWSWRLAAVTYPPNKQRLEL
ncbi:hypothetical protein K438DRAFT_1749083 [Mycena galopus ATCC 62051]|nr:hypothetical protein K438DRAFT_1749083 [Mycena galopus ATCC 62051]